MKFVESKKRIKLVLTIVFASSFFSANYAQRSWPAHKNWAYDSIYISKAEKAIKPLQKQIVVAVIDDAFRLSHHEFEELIWENNAEIPLNDIDDDKNGYIDDVRGWDVADHDNNTSVPEGLESALYHGTYVAGIIARAVRLHYGKQAKDYMKIMPVKALSDNAVNTNITDGYSGVKYAVDNGADIICMAWSGGKTTPQELKYLSEAQKKGILLVASAGNFNHRNIPAPASSPHVLAVGGFAYSSGKEKNSNYGCEIDLVAPSEWVWGAHPEKDSAYIMEGGTSASAALVAASAAILKSKNAELDNKELREILLNSSTPFSSAYAPYNGMLGAGKLNLERALQYLKIPEHRYRYFSAIRSKGIITLNANTNVEQWNIAPSGGYHGITIQPDISQIKHPEKHSFSINVVDTLWKTFFLSDLPHTIVIPADKAILETSGINLKRKEKLEFFYFGNPIDSSKLHCEGITHLRAPNGLVTDGSNGQNYTNNSSCKWLITVKAGRRIQFTFTDMDTEANTDFVYLFDGSETLPSNIIAKFSGNNPPPVVVSSTNQVLVWFLSDEGKTSRGWSFEYLSIE